jgi:hypothetical protein
MRMMEAPSSHASQRSCQPQLREIARPNRVSPFADVALFSTGDTDRLTGRSISWATPG